jgi:hypothetical protein
MTTLKTKHKKLSMKRVFSKTKKVSYTNSIELIKAMMPDEDVIIANYMGAIKKNKKTKKSKKV